MSSSSYSPTTQLLLKTLQQQYPQVGLSFGYVGEDSYWSDDRLWYFFTEVVREGETEPLAFGGYQTNELYELEVAALLRLEQWIQDVVLPHVRPVPWTQQVAAFLRFLFS